MKQKTNFLSELEKRLGVPKRVFVTNLALRFYLKDGWTKKELDSYCQKGEVEIAFPDDVNPYFLLKSGSWFDVEKLNQNVTLQRCFPDQDKVSSIELIKERNG